MSMITIISVVFVIRGAPGREKGVYTKISRNPSLTHLICASCVCRLQDAQKFKTLVMDTERALLALLNDVKPDIETCDPLDSSVNVSATDECSESLKSEFDTEIKIEFEREDDQNADDSGVTTNFDDCTDYTVDGEKELLQRFPKGILKPLPSRKILYKSCPKYVWSLESLKGKTITPHHIEKKFLKKPIRNYYKDKKEKKDSLITERLAQALNACTLLESSNIAAFKSKMKAGYPCFYCKEIHDNGETLRTHQSVHSKVNLLKLLTKGPSDSMIVYADVTDLKCVLCDIPMKSLSDLKDHLKVVHRKKMYEQYTDRVIPFKLISGCDFECQICGFFFETFGAVERHMNIHYRNYVCEKCGSGFITNHRLKLHKSALHKEGTYPCSKCRKVFTTYLKLKVHYDVLHNNKKLYKCVKCSERFIDYFTRQRHMVEKHDSKPILYKCKVCDKAFSRRYSLTIHLKRCHLDEKNVKCDMCEYTCFTVSELDAHMHRHGVGKLHECSVCKKSYARKRTLKEHMRIHNNDRRFVCSFCGQAFVQKCSLKQHLRAHHGDQLAQ